MSTVKTDTLQNRLGTKSIPTDTVVDGSAKAWVNFNGTGTVAIRASFNVSSITDNGAGDYTVNFTTAMADANYATLVTGDNAAAAPTAAAVRIGTANSSFSSVDGTYVHATIFR